MEFRFDLHPIFNQSIIKVNSNLLPVGFRGDRRLALDTATKMAEIINEMGSASARAQGLSNPVTTAQKLRMTDQNIYLLGDPNQGRNGAVVGLLKVGKKSLYVFDQNGQTQMVNAPCVLDFYVHESRQRSGLGRNLFDTMLQQEDFVPQKLAVDRPSDKLLGFLRKHYGLQKTIPQMNNFVVYDGFFEKPKPQENNVTNHDGRMHITASPNTALFGPQFINDEQNKRSKAQQNASNTSIPLIQNSPVGRYAAPRPMCSMAECLSTDEVDPSMNRLNPSASGLNKQTPSNVGINITNSVNTNANLHRPSSSNIMANNTNNPALNNMPRSSPSTTSMNRPSSSNTGLNKPAPSNTLINRERAAGLPSQNYNQHGDAPTSLNELSPQTQTPMQAPTQGVTQVPMQGSVQAQIQGPNQVSSQINMDVNPAEPIGKTNLATQEGKVQSEQPIYTEAPNDVLQEVCPHCATTFPSRSSTMKIVTSKVSLSNQQANVVNNQANDAIIHNTATPATGEPNSTSEIPSATEPYHAVINETVNVNTVNVNIENLQLSEHEDNEEHEHDVEEKQEEHQEQHHEDLTNGHDHKEKEVKIDPIQRFIEEQVVEPIVEAVHIQKPTSFPLSKQHTGLKNISYNVSLAVSPTNKMEFIQKGPNDSKHDHPDEEKPAGLPSHENIDEESATSSPGSGGAFTDQGYFDLKFYHNKLW